MTTPKINFDFNKLQSLIDDWIDRFDHIAEITFFQNTPPNRPYGIDLVLCDPPRISPKWKDPHFIKDDFFKNGGKMLTDEIVQNAYPEVPPAFINHPNGALCDYRGQAIKFKEWADHWIFIIRWETDPLYLATVVPESKKNLYSAPKVMMEDMLRKISAEDYDHFSRLSYFTDDECLDLLCGFPISKKNAIYNPKVRLDKEFLKFKKGAALKWSEEFDRNIQKNEEVFNQAIENGELDLWARDKGLTVDAGPFLKWAKEKGFSIPIDLPVLTDDAIQLKNQEGERTDAIDQITLKAPKGIHDGTDQSIKNLSIRFENDSQITIQEKGKQRIPIPLEQLRFKNSKKKLVWNNFLAVLKDPPYYYWKCPEDRDKKQIDAVSKRLMEWLKNNMGLTIPPKYKLYERVKGAEPGTYCFKFKIECSDTIEEDLSSKKKFRDKFFSVIEEYKKNPSESKLQSIKDMAANGFSKGYLTETEVKEMLKPDKININPDKEFIGKCGYSIIKK